MKYSLLTIFFTALLTQNQELEAVSLPQINDVQTALTLPHSPAGNQKGVLITTNDNLFLLTRVERVTAPKSLSVAKITPGTRPDVYNVVGKNGNILATLTTVLDRMHDGATLLAYIKAQPQNNIALTYITKTGAKISFAGSATALENAAKKSTYIIFQAMNNGVPYALFKNGSTTVGTFAVSLALQ